MAVNAVENQHRELAERREAKREANDPVYRAKKQAIRFAEAEARAKEERREARLQLSKALFYILWIGCGIGVVSTQSYSLIHIWLMYIWFSLIVFGLCSWTMNFEDISIRLQRICWLFWLISVLCFCALILTVAFGTEGSAESYTQIAYTKAGWLGGGALWIAVWKIGERYGY